MNMSRSYSTGFYLHHQFDFVEGTRHDIQTLKIRTSGSLQTGYIPVSSTRVYTQLLTKFGLCWMNMETLELKDWFVKKNTDYFKNDILDVSRAFQTRPNKPHS